MNSYVGTKRRALLVASISFLAGIIITIFADEVKNINITILMQYILFQSISEPRPEMFLAIISCLIPFLILVFPLTNIISNDLQICSVYMFTRYNNREIWYFKKNISLFLYTFLSCFLYFVTIIAALTLRGAHFDFQTYSFLLQFANIFLFLFTMSLFVNIMSIILPTHLSFLLLVGGLGLQVSLALIVKINANSFYYINSINNYFYIWRDDTPSILNLIIQFVISLIIFIIGLVIIKSIDISTIDKDYT